MNLSRRMVMAGGMALSLARPAFAAPATPLALPVGPMVLTRRLDRSLGADRTITVERQWQIGFSRDGPDIIVHGSQTGVAVDAPPALATLVAIEKARDASSLFPLTLSSEGRIVPDHGDNGLGAGAPADISAAIAAAQRLIAEHGGAPGDHRSNLAAIQAAGYRLLETMPPDLFFPQAGGWHDEQLVDLPGGHSGVIAMDYSASCAANSRWLQRAERAVTTRLDGTQRLSSEVWTLSPA